MSENENAAPPAPPPPEPQVQKASRWLPSLVWLIPLLAALIGVALVAKSIIDQGETVTVSFRSGDGLEPGKTKVKYKDVDIGLVRTISLSRDLSKVLVTIEMSKGASRFTSADSRFWVVRPRIGASGVSGLGTLLSGAYIGVDAGKSEETSKEFVGLEKPAQVAGDEKGSAYTLHSDNLGSVDVGSPIFYRRIQVGQVTSFDLDEKGRGVKMNVFITAPYDQYVGQNTRWWHASGVDVRLDSSGFKVNTQSLAAVLVGGIAFESMTGQKPDTVAKAGSDFLLAADQASALREPDGTPITTVLYFDQSLRGLSPGAPVDFRGVVIGEVKSIGVQFDRDEREFRMPVLVTIYPERLRMRQPGVPAESRYTQEQRLRFLVEKGLRAQMRTGNLLTGQNYIALDFFPKAPAVKVAVEKVPFEMPTLPNSLDELQSQVQEIATKLNKVPFEQIGADVRTALATLNKTLISAEQLTRTLNNDVSPEITAAMKDARKTINSAERTLAQDSPLQQDMRQTLQELTRAAGSVRVLTDYLERHPESLLRGKPEDKKK